MIRSDSATRTMAVTVLTLAVLIAPFVAWQSAQGGEAVYSSALAPRGIVVVGDSITAVYNDKPGSARQGWWSFVGRRFDARVTTYAQSGSGYLRPGKRCTGNRFIDRDRVYGGGAAPSMVIVEGGRNDWAVCRRGQFVTASDATIEHAVDGYLGTLRTFLPDSTRIVVLGPPWGPLDRANGQRVTAIIERVAARHELEFISTHGSLDQRAVVDGIHPNRRGSKAIAQRVIAALAD